MSLGPVNQNVDIKVYRGNQVNKYNGQSISQLSTT